jgi:hypothetical protein
MCLTTSLHETEDQFRHRYRMPYCFGDLTLVFCEGDLTAASNLLIVLVNR